MGKTLCLKTTADKILFTIILLVPIFSLAISGYVIAGKHYNTTCDVEKIIPLPVWLIINSTVMLASVIILWIFYIKANTNNHFLSYTFYVNTVYVLFLIAFNIVATVQFFKYSDNCKVTDHSLWAMMLATIIIQYVIIAVKPFIMMGALCCDGCSHYSDVLCVDECSCCCDFEVFEN